MSLPVEPGAGRPGKQGEGTQTGCQSNIQLCPPLSAANTPGCRLLTCRVCRAWAGRDRALGCGQRGRCVPSGHVASNFPGQSAGKRDSSVLQLKPCSPAQCTFQRSLQRACSTHRPAALLGHSKAAPGGGEAAALPRSAGHRAPAQKMFICHGGAADCPGAYGQC